MKKLEVSIGLLVLALTLAAGACKQPQSAAAPSDQTITSDIQAKLFQDPVLKTRDITVNTQSAVVTLTGSVNSDDEKASVEKIANQESGVKQVADQLTVATAAASAAPPQTAAPPPPPPPQAEPSGRKHHHEAESSASGAGSAASSAQGSTPAPPPMVTIPAGTTVTVRMIDPVDSSVGQPGQEYAASLAAPIVAGDRVVVPSGANATVSLVNAKTSGRFQGSAQLTLELHSLTINGATVRVQSSAYQQAGGSRGRNTAEKVGGGAVIGGLIGAIAGGGKGAAIGAGIGGAGGGGLQAFTKRGVVKVPSEAKIDFALTAPISVTLSR